MLRIQGCNTRFGITKEMFFLINNLQVIVKKKFFIRQSIMTYIKEKTSSCDVGNNNKLIGL